MKINLFEYKSFTFYKMETNGTQLLKCHSFWLHLRRSRKQYNHHTSSDIAVNCFLIQTSRNRQTCRLKAHKVTYSKCFSAAAIALYSPQQSHTNYGATFGFTDCNPENTTLSKESPWSIFQIMNVSLQDKCKSCVHDWCVFAAYL